MTKSNLGPFTTIEEELLFVDVDHLSCGVLAGQWQGRSTTEDGDLEPQAGISAGR